MPAAQQSGFPPAGREGTPITQSMASRIVRTTSDVSPSEDLLVEGLRDPGLS
jgi:hypothetical protein